VSGRTATERYDVVCPHCKKTFTGELLTGETPRQRGFKCPHCRLFVPYDRADNDGDPSIKG
jgi:DNA-directed RNA polymerase subunit RPC12/RpoP